MTIIFFWSIMSACAGFLAGWASCYLLCRTPAKGPEVDTEDLMDQMDDLHNQLAEWRRWAAQIPKQGER